jgi:hypothetical protein
LKKDKNGLPEAIPMWRAKKGSKPDDPFFEHTILLEPLVGRYIDHVLRSKNGCLILNPASHLKLHDNLKGGYFTKVKFVIKLTYTKAEDPYSQIHTSIDCVPYHTKAIGVRHEYCQNEGPFPKHKDPSMGVTFRR